MTIFFSHVKFLIAILNSGPKPPRSANVTPLQGGAIFFSNYCKIQNTLFSSHRNKRKTPATETPPKSPILASQDTKRIITRAHDDSASRGKTKLSRAQKPSEINKIEIITQDRQRYNAQRNDHPSRPTRERP